MLKALAALTVAALATSAAATPSGAAAEELAVLHGGVVWEDEGPVQFQGFWSNGRTLGGVRDRSAAIASSATAVAVSASGEFQASIPPGHLFTIEPIEEPVPTSECPDGWVPSAAGEFAVVHDELVASGECNGVEDLGEEQSQPLFVRHLPHGNWHVLRWIEGYESPTLAAEGGLLAIGERSPSNRMRVTIVDLAAHHVLARFGAPAGQLAFASDRRIVLLERVRCGRVAALVPRKARRCLTYRGELYSFHGRALADLGQIAEPSRISRMHILVDEPLPGGGTALAVRGLLGGRPRGLVGFEEPARTLAAVAFRWPAVAVAETTAAPLLQSEVTCTSGEYHRPGATALRIFDVARAEPYVPLPPIAHLAGPTGCIHTTVPPIVQ